MSTGHDGSCLPRCVARTEQQVSLLAAIVCKASNKHLKTDVGISTVPSSLAIALRKVTSRVAHYMRTAGAAYDCITSHLLLCNSRYASLFDTLRSFATFFSAAFSSTFSSAMICSTR